MARVSDFDIDIVMAGLHYTRVISEIFAQIQDPVAAAIWVYLQDKPKGWIVRRGDVMRRWDIGRDRWQKAAKELRGLNLLSEVVIKDGMGRIESRKLIIAEMPLNILEDIRIAAGNAVHASGLKNLPQENPQAGETVPITNTDYLTNTDSNLNTCSTSVERERDFDDFYFKYPKKVGKDQARKAWNKLNPSKTLIQQMHDNICAKFQAGEWSHIEKQFIPALGPYLNQKKWQDEIIQRRRSNGNQQVPKLTPAQRIAAKAKQRRESHAVNGDAVASYGGNVRSGMVDPIWG